LWLVADHPISGIVSSANEGAAITACSLTHGPDSTGKTVAVMKLQTAVSIDSENLSVTIDGLRHPVTGLLMTNPADVCWDLLQWASGRAVDRGRFALWAAACQREGIEAHGVVRDPSATIRALLDTITVSAGSLWSGAMPDFGRLLPELDRTETPIAIPGPAVSSVASESRLDDIATVVTVRFGYDWAVGDYTGSVTYHAPEAVKDFGTIERVIEAPWCPTSRQAARIAEAHCKRLAVSRWTITVDGDRSLTAIEVGAPVSATHRLLPAGVVSGALATGIDRDHESGVTTLTLDSAATPPPAVKIAGWSGKFSVAAPTGTKVVIGKGEIALTIANDKGTALPGAVAILDGDRTATADAAGLVVFRAVAAGKHQVEVRAAGYTPYTIEVTAA
jgi:hypothetical protein